VEQGACISISSGLNVDVWNSLGFLFYLFFKPIPNVNLVRLPPYMVADLICPIRRTWNFLLLQDLFDPLMVQNIITIHLPVCGSFDKWVWAHLLQGIFR
jgi:hypothetical protein